jgi:hypothetical protein
LNNTVQSNLRIHFFYVTFILCLTIVLLVSFRWSALEGFTTYLNVAATLNALIVGVLAIIYSFLSNGSINQSLGSVQSASSQMGAVSSEMQAAVRNAQVLQEKADARTEKLHDLIIDMQSGLGELASTTEKIAGSVDSISDRISNSQKSAPKEQDPLFSTGQEDSIDIKESRYAVFIRKSSPLGLLSVYAALQASRSSLYVDFQKLVPKSNYDYVWGFLVASSSSGIVSLEYPKNKRGMRAVRLKNPAEDLANAVDAAWELAPESKKTGLNSLHKRYASRIDGSFVDSAPGDW